MNNKFKHILFVEGESDERFFRTLLQYVQKKEDIETSIQALEYSIIGGSDVELIKKSLRQIRTDLRNKEIEQIGIIIDIDNHTIEKRLNQINEAATDVFGDYEFVNFEIDKRQIVLKPNAVVSVIFSFHIIQDATGKGNIESLLKDIITVNPTAANCLEDWLNCANKNGANIKQRDYLKMWRDVYVRYDYCKPKELNKHAAENCTFEKSLENMLIDEKPKAWDFGNKALDPLKQYLTQFQ